MKLFSLILLLSLSGSFLFSCVQKICPAYESFFLLDSTRQAKTFTYFGEDTMPRQDMRLVTKSKFGIIDEGLEARLPYPIRSPFAKINMIEREVIYPQIEDSLAFTGDELMLAEMDIVDSTALTAVADSAEGKIWHYNIDQENYFNYVRQRLNLQIGWVDASELQDAMLAADSTALAAEQPVVADTTKKKGMFKKFFNKKKKEEKPVESEPEPEEEPDEENGF